MISTFDAEDFIRNDWIPALRSGKYKQAREELRLEFSDGSVGFCCLGVALDRLNKRGTVQGSWDGKRFVLPDGSIVSQTLNPDVTRPLGFVADKTVRLKNDTLVDEGDDLLAGPVVDGQTLASHNDAGKTFVQIADLIEAWLARKGTP
jgi:hypothetical protein